MDNSTWNPLESLTLKGEEETWNPLESLTLKGEEETIKTGDAIELAYAFASYKGMRVADLETRMDCQMAGSAARRLRKTQNELGIYLVGTHKLEATERRMARYGNVLKTHGSV